MAKKPYYITTAIAYASGKPHIGNTYEIVLADSIARYKRFIGYDVRFQTGTDEHGQKIETKAFESLSTPQEFVDEKAAEIKRIWDLMNTSYDKFIRTTDKDHEEEIKQIFKKLYDKGDIYKGKYEGLYCTPCESFWTKAQVVDGCCPDCGRPVAPASEEAYFFKMSKYADRLIKYIEDNPEFIQPESRKNEMVNTFLKPGLQDLCVSRTSFKWGIPVDFDPKHVVYVWIDALSNYITGLGYHVNGQSDPMFEKYWPCDLHLIGKDILRFHTIYWPIMLMALDLPLPKQVFGHPWLIQSDGKMSKSKGNVHLLFNIGTSIFMLIITNKVVKVCDKIVGEDEENEADKELMKLDPMLLNTPVVALEQCKSLITKMGEAIVENYKTATRMIYKYDADAFPKMEARESFIDKCETALSSYVVRIDRHRLTASDKLVVSEILNSISDFERMGDYCMNIAYVAQDKNEKKIHFSPYGHRNDDASLAVRGEPLSETIDNLKEIIKSHHVERLQDGDCSIEGGVSLFDLINSFERIASHAANISLHVIKRVKGDSDFDEMHGHANDIYSEEYKALQHYYESQYIDPILRPMTEEEMREILEDRSRREAEWYGKKEDNSGKEDAKSDKDKENEKSDKDKKKSEKSKKDDKGDKSKKDDKPEKPQIQDEDDWDEVTEQLIRDDRTFNTDKTDKLKSDKSKKDSKSDRRQSKKNQSKKKK